MDGYSCASRGGRDCSTIATCLGIYVSFESVSQSVQRVLAGAERVPRKRERHAKERDSLSAGGAPLYDATCGCVEHSRKERRRPSTEQVAYPSPGL